MDIFRFHEDLINLIFSFLSIAAWANAKLGLSHALKPLLKDPFHGKHIYRENSRNCWEALAFLGRMGVQLTRSICSPDQSYISFSLIPLNSHDLCDCAGHCRGRATVTVNPYAMFDQWFNEREEYDSDDYSEGEIRESDAELVLAVQVHRSEGDARRFRIGEHLNVRNRLISNARESGTLVESIRDVRRSNNSYAARSEVWGSSSSDDWHHGGIVKYDEPPHSFTDTDVGFAVVPWCGHYIAPGSTAPPDPTLLQLSQQY
jgi:hypothetical protein